MATVTIAKSYFDALLRRGEFHTDGVDALPPTDAVTIAQGEYAQLIKAAREYAILRDALLRGGLNQNTLNLLISGSDTQQEQDDASWDQDTFQRPAAVSVSITKPCAYQDTPAASEKLVNGSGHGYLSQPYQDGTQHRSYSFGAEGSMADGAEKEEGMNGNWRNGTNPSSTNDQRTLLFTGLPERTTHAELTSIVKGGMLIDIFVRNDRTATISFSSAHSASAFLSYAKKTDIYLRTKRLSVSWNDRQFRMPNHIANKIAGGASRNIVVRGGLSRDLTEQGIRDDLDHIHNLVVISVKANHKSGDIFISTNSVHNALFARTCMMSRALYKGLKIEYYPDECDVPVPKTPERAPPPPAVPVSSSRKPSMQSTTRSLSKGNPYALLAEDGAADDNSDKENESIHSDEQALPGARKTDVKINWAD